MQTPTVARFSEERDIEIDDVEIEIQGDLDPRTFLGHAENVRAGYRELQVDIEVESDADDALATLAEEVEKRCPVGDNIANPTPTSVNVASLD